MICYEEMRVSFQQNPRLFAALDFYQATDLY
jgi:hypothetical protein